MDRIRSKNILRQNWSDVGPERPRTRTCTNTTDNGSIKGMTVCAESCRHIITSVKFRPASTWKHCSGCHIIFNLSVSPLCIQCFDFVTVYRVHRIKKDRRQKESQRKQKAAECRKHLTNIRFAVFRFLSLLPETSVFFCTAFSFLSVGSGTCMNQHQWSKYGSKIRSKQGSRLSQWVLSWRFVVNETADCFVKTICRKDVKSTAITLVVYHSSHIQNLAGADFCMAWLAFVLSLNLSLTAS